MQVLDEFLLLTKVNLELVWHSRLDEIAPNILSRYDKKANGTGEGLETETVRRKIDSKKISQICIKQSRFGYGPFTLF